MRKLLFLVIGTVVLAAAGVVLGASARGDLKPPTGHEAARRLLDLHPVGR